MILCTITVQQIQVGGRVRIPSVIVIIGSVLLAKLRIDIKNTTNTIECGEGNYQGCTTPMNNLNEDDFEPIKRKIPPFLE